MTITPVRCCREARDVSGRDCREHAFDLNGRHVVALVVHDVAIGADDIVKVIAAREGLDHRDVELLRQSASRGAESPYRPRRDLEKFAEPFDPLFDVRLAMDEDEGGAPAAGYHVSSRVRSYPTPGVHTGRRRRAEGKRGLQIAATR